MANPNEKHKIDLVRNKIQENDFRSVDFHFALVEQDNIWRIFVAKIIFSENEKQINKTILKKENFALEDFSFSISEFEDFLNYLENVYSGNIIKSGNDFEMNDELFYKFGDYKLSFVGNFPSSDIHFFGRDVAKKHHGIDKPIFTFDYAINNQFSVTQYPQMDFTNFEIPLRNITEVINHFWKTNFEQHSMARDCKFYFPLDGASISSYEVLGKKVNISFDTGNYPISELTLSVIAENDTMDFRKPIPIKENPLSIDLGFIPTTISFYLFKDKEKLDDLHYYIPREENDDAFFGEMRIKSTITKTKNIVLFIGAGASIQFDIPATKEFKNYLIQNDSTGVRIFQTLLAQDEFPDIEHVLTCLKELMDTPKTHAGLYLGKDSNKILVNDDPPIQVNEVFGQAPGLYNFIMQKLFEKYQIEPNCHSVLNNFYSELFGLLNNYSKRIDVGTTNYDLAIETFCNLNASSYTCIDGFKIEGTKFVWNARKFEETFKRASEQPISLYKIHGSLNWIRDGSAITKTERIEYKPTKNDTLNVIIAPTLSPKTGSEVEPFKSLFEKFIERLDNSDVCIVIGTSFRDEIIAKKFVDFIEKGKHLIIISPTCYQNYARELYNQKSIPDLNCTEWAKFYSLEKDGRVTFIDLSVSPETNNELFSRLKLALEKN